MALPQVFTIDAWRIIREFTIDAWRIIRDLSPIILTLLALYFTWIQVSDIVKSKLINPDIDVRLVENIGHDRMSTDKSTQRIRNFFRERPDSKLLVERKDEPDYRIDLEDIDEIEKIQLHSENRYELFYFVIGYIKGKSSGRLQEFLFSPVVFSPLRYWFIFPADFRVLRDIDSQEEDIPKPSNTSLHETNITVINTEKKASYDNLAYGTDDSRSEFDVIRPYSIRGEVEYFTAGETHAVALPVWVRTPDREMDSRIISVIDPPHVPYKQEKIIEVSVVQD